MPIPQRTIGLYALATMSRDGPVHGYQLAERIAAKTGGAWRPGAGAIYPALQRLIARRLARARTEGRRRVYTITPKGRAVLARIRRRTSAAPPRVPDLSVLWAEVAGLASVPELLLVRLRRSLDAVESVLASGGTTSAEATQELRAETLRELSVRLERLKRGSTPSRSVRPSRGVRRRP